MNPFDPQELISAANLNAGLAARADSLDAGLHRQIVERVAAMYRAAMRDLEAASEPYQPGGEWAAYCAERRHFYDHLLAGRVELAAGLLRNFWRNELGPIVKEYARFDQLARGEEPFTSRFQQNVVRNYLIWRDLFHQPIDVLEIPRIGNPWGYVIEGRVIAPKATRFHAVATESRRLLEGINRPVAAEIGGGYCGMAYFLLRDAPQTVYVDFDLPETLAIAAYYLLATLPERRIYLYGEGPLPTQSRLDDFDAVLLPHFALPTLADRSIDLWINTFSLSEVPWDTLQEYIRQIERTARGHFYHNNMDRRGVVNRGFERIPASTYPVDPDRLKLVYKHFDLFHGHDGDYRQFLYQCREATAC